MFRSYNWLSGKVSFVTSNNAENIIQIVIFVIMYIATYIATVHEIFISREDSYK